MMTYRKSTSFNLDGITGVLILIGSLVALYFIIKYTLLALAVVAPLLLVATLIIDHTVVVNYLKWIGSTLKTNPLLGVGAIVFTVLGYSLVFPFLFVKALLKKKFKKAYQRYENERQGELVDFEELESRPTKETKGTKVELPPLKEPQAGKRSEYDQLFE